MLFYEGAEMYAWCEAASIRLSVQTLYILNNVKCDADLMLCSNGARGSVVVKALCYKPEGRGYDTRWGEFLSLFNPSGRTRPWGLLSPNRNEYQKQNNNVSGE
jgi:hypothetical protein